MKPEIEIISERLLSALFDGTWQGLLIVFTVWVALKLSPRANAATRYAAWMATLMILAILPVAHFSIRTSAANQPVAKPRPIDNFTPAIAQESFAEVTDLDSVDLTSVPEISNAPEPLLAPSRTWHFALPKHYSLYLICAWLILAAIRLGALAGQLFVLHRIKRKAVLAGGPLVRSFASIHRDMRVERPALLLTSGELRAPMVVGFRKACVLLPRAICEEASAAQLEHVLRHELAHVARRDDWANLIQQAIHAIFFFHPGVHFASRRLTMEREIACDDHAIAATAARKDYALFLTEFASRVRGRDFTAAPAAWSHTSQLKERISMILDGKRNSSPRLARARAAGITAGALLLALLAFQTAPRLIVAAESERGPSANASAGSTASVETDGNAVTVVATTETSAKPTVAVITAPRAAVASTISVAPVPATPARPVSPPSAVLIAPGAPHAPVALALADDVPPGPGGPPKHKRGPDDDSIERRLDRLERLVEKLANAERGKSDKDKYNKMNMTPKMAKPERDGDEWDHMRDEIRRNREQADREKEHAMRERDRVMREQQRAMAHDMEKQAREAGEQAARAAEQAAQAAQGSQDPLRAKREALQRVRRSIDQQLEAVQRQIEQQERKEKPDKQEKGERKEKEKAPEDNSPKK